MSSSRVLKLILILPLFLHLLITPNHADQGCSPTTKYCWNCFDVGSNSANTVYKDNLNSIIVSIASPSTSDQNFTGFYNTSFGQNADKVNVIALCRGDLKPDDCRSCLYGSYDNLLRICPNTKEAILWDEHCMLRYSFNDSIISIEEDEPSMELGNPQNSKDPEQFNQKLKPLLDDLINKAAAGDSLRKYAHGNTTVPNAEQIFALLQCTPDLSQKECHDCLQDASSRLPLCCEANQGVRILKPSCNLRYEPVSFWGSDVSTCTGEQCRSPPPPNSPTKELFFNESAFQSPPPPLPPPPPPPGKTKKLLIVVVATGVPVVVTALLVVMGCLFIRRRARKKYNALITRESAANDLTRMESLQFDFKSIENATDKFADYNMLGKGGFGEVYKGTLPNGREIAVKRLSKSSGQGSSEFKNEVVLVAKLQHRNLVRLLGFCLDGDERILVYEYVPNKSLDYFLFDPEKQGQLNWPIRCNIIEEIARGVLYLHEDSRLKIIHRDLKASNILLDKKMNPKVSDFGMAKMFGVDQTQGNTRRIVGTYGYMAPEYAMEGLYSIKSDVFSFGVLLLEILSGRRNTSFHITDCALSLIAYAWQLWNEGKALDLVDSCLKDSCHDPNKFLRYIQIGLLCVQEDAILRPTMSSVVLMLKSEALSLSQPERPAFIANRHTSQQEVIALRGSSVNRMTVSDFLPR